MTSTLKTVIRKGLNNLGLGLLQEATDTISQRPCPTDSPPITAVNIGGGPCFSAAGWLNLDEAAGQQNKTPFKLDARCTFPLPDSSVKLVYSSHALEHMDDETVCRCLSEAHRVLQPGGDLVIKIPDFEKTLECWRNGNESYFTSTCWGLDSVIPTWTVKGVKDSITSRAAMIFCGFWNAEYGDHFSLSVQKHPTAYHGPPALAEEHMREVLSLGQPRQIAAAFRQHVVDNEASYKFNHQNAWTAEEFSSLIASAGFVVLSCDDDIICQRFASIPYIREMRDISLYTWCTRK